MADKGDWHSWNDSFALARGWPYPSSGIDVDPRALKQVAFQMERTVADVSDGGPYDINALGSGEGHSWDNWPSESGIDDPGAAGKLPKDTKETFNLSGTFGHEVLREQSWSGPYGGGGISYDVAGHLPGSWESVKLFQATLERTIATIDGYGDLFFESFKGLADTVVLTASNYQAVEDILEHGKGGFRASVNGKGVIKGEEPLRQGGWFCENVSGNEAPVIKIFFERGHPERLVEAGRVLRKTADKLAGGVHAIEGHAQHLAKAWPGESSTLCLDALRKLHASGRMIAYAAGRTSEVCGSFGASFAQYKRLGEGLNVDKAGWFDRTFHDGDEDDARDKARAQELLTRFNATMGDAFAQLPAELEVYLPRLDSFQYPEIRVYVPDRTFADLVDEISVKDGLRNLRSVDEQASKPPLPRS